MYGETVVALSTPPGESGIAVIRLSGPDAVAILEGMVQTAHPWESHKTHRRILRNSRGEVLDEVLATVMRGPNTYTGEDVVEISCHGSMHITSEIIEETIFLGAAHAGHGEFTKRAYLNGRLDLVQAEAVADLISAETRLQSRVALQQLEGKLSRKIKGLEKKLLEQLALVEASIDFPEEDIEMYGRSGLMSFASGMIQELKELINSEIAGKKLRNGIRVTILGPRNAGKSSIYNALLGEERAIVSPVPGTTRDLIRERIHIEGFTYYLEDTAGIARTECEIETRGMEIGRKAAGEADLVMFVIDGSIEWTEETGKELDLIRDRNHIVVINKSDKEFKASIKKISGKDRACMVIKVSAVTGKGLPGLKQAIYQRTVRNSAADTIRERGALNARQAAALREAAEALRRLEREIERGGAVEILSLELMEVAGAFGKVTGRSIAEEVLETIFDRFCIGK